MHEDTFAGVVSTLYEIIYLISYPVVCIKENLVLLIEPIERKVDHSDVLPKVADLASSTVYYMSHFVGHYEFDVLI